MKTPAIGRNDPCPCSSGKKFKNCCLGKENGAASSHGAAGRSEILREALKGRQFVSLEEAQVFLDQSTQQQNRRRLENASDSAYELQTARRLESRYPEAILKYYLSGLGNLKTKAPRKEYTRKAQVMKRVHHVLVDVLGDVPRWRDFAINVKQDNIKRPAFQEEFAKAVPGWQALK